MLSIQFDKIRNEGSYKELLEALERGFIKFGIDYYLVGALARDVWMKGVYNIQPRRATKDIDFGILIQNTEMFAQLKEYLINTEGFNPYKENSFVLIWKDKTQVDLIPFGELENEGVATVKGTGFTSMNVEGFQEVYEKTVEIEIEYIKHFKVCTLPGFVVLKLIAWDDRPEVRSDDIKDIAEILIHYFQLNDIEIWEKHSDLFSNPDIDLVEVAAQFMGREIYKIVTRNEMLKQRIIGILEQGISSDRTNKLDELLAKNLDKTIEFCRSLISYLLAGIKDIR
jgi:predicted nucleotidyltransferase